MGKEFHQLEDDDDLEEEIVPVDLDEVEAKFKEKHPYTLSGDEFRKQAEERKSRFFNFLPKPLRKKFKTFAAAFFLLTIGLIFGILGIVDISNDDIGRGIAFLVISVISLIPGTYVMHLAVKLLRNPEVSKEIYIPSYDDEF